MKKLLITFSVVLLACAGVAAQSSIKIYTSPKLPMRDALERMNFVTAWNSRVTVDGNRDGILSIQLLPGKTNQLVIQTFKGGVFLYDADNGDLIWKTHVGVPYWTAQPAAFNSQSIFVTRRNILHVLNRFDGSQRVYTFEAGSKLPTFGYTLFFTPNAAPTADEDFLYLSMGDQLNAVFIPDFAAVEKARQTRERFKKEGKELRVPLPGEEYIPEGLSSPQPIYYWGYRFGREFTTSSPMVYGEQMSVLTTDGTLASLGRYEKGPREELFEFKVTGKSPAAPAQYRNLAYVGSDDFNLYAINMNNGRLAWRYVSGAPILIAPYANDRDVFVSPKRGGLRRIDRISGREIRINRDAERFLAANDAYVYALDHIGKFHVVDSRRGTTLATLDLSDWAVPMANEWTDRIYLAANDGQVMCLRHRDNVKPLIMKTIEVPKIFEPKKPMEEPKKEEDKKEEKKDDKEKAAAPPTFDGSVAELPRVPLHDGTRTKRNSDDLRHLPRDWALTAARDERHNWDRP